MNNSNPIKKYKNNSNLDLEKIINEYSGYVYKIIKNMTNENFSDEDFEEILSDTFFILWKNTDKLDDNKKMSSYIAGIVRNLVKEKSRKIKINLDISDYENNIQDLERIDMITEKREKMSIIESSLRQMSEEDMKIFNMYYYSTRKIREIAVILECSEFKVKSKLYRIRKKIKKDLEKGGYRYDG